jgi:hypothetical protein
LVGGTGVLVEVLVGVMETTAVKVGVFVGMGDGVNVGSNGVLVEVKVWVKVGTPVGVFDGTAVKV